jgi:hypothetical protein
MKLRGPQLQCVLHGEEINIKNIYLNQIFPVLVDFINIVYDYEITKIPDFLKLFIMADVNPIVKLQCMPY